MNQRPDDFFLGEASSIYAQGPWLLRSVCTFDAHYSREKEPPYRLPSIKLIFHRTRIQTHNALDVQELSPLAWPELQSIPRRAPGPYLEVVFSVRRGSASAAGGILLSWQITPMQCLAAKLFLDNYVPHQDNCPYQIKHIA